MFPVSPQEHLCKLIIHRVPLSITPTKGIDVRFVIVGSLVLFVVVHMIVKHHQEFTNQVVYFFPSKGPLFQITSIKGV